MNPWDTTFSPAKPFIGDNEGTAAAAPPRILIVDDNQAIHEDFRKILLNDGCAPAQLRAMESVVFGATEAMHERNTFRIDSAFQGQEALALVQRALAELNPYSLVFVDHRMPPGWDGVQTLEELWRCSPDLQAVICTAYSDYSWDDMTRRLGPRDGLLILKKPFDTVEVLQLVHALTRKWMLTRQARLRMDDLDRMVAERTRKLREESKSRLRVESQLRQAQKMEAIGCLSAGIAHEFNNLLTVIQGHAGLVRARPGDPRFVTESAERIAQAGERAASLTRQLLAFSRKQPIQLRPIDLSATVESSRRMIARLLGERYVLELNCPSGLPPALADLGHVEQVLINLVLNARDAMPDGGTICLGTGGVEIDAGAVGDHPEARPGRFVCLTVTDSGCGMSREVLSRIFDPFYTTKEVGKGTGLGLSMVHGIVQQHHGWVEVDSEPGRGSRFRIFLPVCPVLPAPAGESAPEAAASLPCGAGQTVLLVEDEATVRCMARSVLERGGYRVIEAADGPQALALWERSETPIDLLVTDLVMPNGVSGGELARQLKRLDPGLRAIFTSGYSSEVVREDLVLLQDPHFLRKPYDSMRLLRAVESSLANQEVES